MKIISLTSIGMLIGIIFAFSANIIFAYEVTPLHYDSFTDIIYGQVSDSEYFISYNPDGSYANGFGGSGHNWHNCPLHLADSNAVPSINCESEQTYDFYNSNPATGVYNVDFWLYDPSTIGDFHILIVDEDTYQEIVGVGCFTSYSDCISSDAVIFEDYTIQYIEPGSSGGSGTSTPVTNSTTTISIDTTFTDALLLIFTGTFIFLFVFFGFIYYFKKRNTI